MSLRLHHKKEFFSSEFKLLAYKFSSINITFFILHMVNTSQERYTRITNIKVSNFNFFFSLPKNCLSTLRYLCRLSKTDVVHGCGGIFVINGNYTTLLTKSFYKPPLMLTLQRRFYKKSSLIKVIFNYFIQFHFH